MAGFFETAVDCRRVLAIVSTLCVGATLGLTGCQDIVGVDVVVPDDAPDDPTPDPTPDPDPMCGDGLVTDDESCDGDGLGNGGETATCDIDCTVRECGDSLVNASSGEDCDTAGNSATCDSDCTAPACGDALVNPSFEPVAGSAEECDDGNDDDNDDCRNTCVASFCGDGVVHDAGTGTEQCDGNDDAGCPGLCTDDCACRRAISCQDQLLADPASPDGVYTIAPPGAGATIDVFCDMTTDGGGWTAIDPAAAVAFGGTANTTHSVGQTTCRVNAAGLFEAFYDSPSGTDELICQYDIPLGFRFDTLRVVDAPGDEVLSFAPVVGPGNVYDLIDGISAAWGAPRADFRGDILLGTPSRPTPVLGLGRVLGTGSFGAGQQVIWRARETEVSTADTVLRMQISESGSEDEGMRWQSGRIFVRDSTLVPGR